MPCVLCPHRQRLRGRSSSELRHRSRRRRKKNVARSALEDKRRSLAAQSQVASKRPGAERLCVSRDDSETSRLETHRATLSLRRTTCAFDEVGVIP